MIFKIDDTVFVKPSKRYGKIIDIKDDYITVEISGDNLPDRIDTYYASDLELVEDSFDEQFELSEDALDNYFALVKKFKKHQKGLVPGYVLNTNAGNVEANNAFFNAGTTAASESLHELYKLSDLKAFYNTSSSIDKEKYPDFFTWANYMIKSGKVNLSENWCDDTLAELSEKSKKDWTEDDWDTYNYCMNANAERDYYNSLDEDMNWRIAPNNSREVDQFVYNYIRKFDRLIADNSRYWDFERGIREGDDAFLVAQKDLPKTAKYMFSFLPEVDIDIYLDTTPLNDTWYVVSNEAIAENLNESLSFDELKELTYDFEKYLASKPEYKYLYDEIYFDEHRQAVVVEIDMGDWKHEHLFLDNVADEWFAKKGYKIDHRSVITNDTQSDTYGARHIMRLQELKPISMIIDNATDLEQAKTDAQKYANQFKQPVEIKSDRVYYPIEVLS